MDPPSNPPSILRGSSVDNPWRPWRLHGGSGGNGASMEPRNVPRTLGGNAASMEVPRQRNVNGDSMEPAWRIGFGGCGGHRSSMEAPLSPLPLWRIHGGSIDVQFCLNCLGPPGRLQFPSRAWSHGASISSVEEPPRKKWKPPGYPYDKKYFSFYISHTATKHCSFYRYTTRHRARKTLLLLHILYVYETQDK